MWIEFVIRTEGARRDKFITAEMDGVPRVGESVIIDDETTRTVYSVDWDLRDDTTTDARVVLK